MLQRFQTIFWVLSIALIVIYVLLMREMTIAVYLFAIGALILNFWAIFSYRNRKGQLVLSYLTIIFNTVIIVLNIRQYKSPEGMLLFLLVGSILMNILANYFTKKDIKLLEESSRLR